MSQAGPISEQVSPGTLVETLTANDGNVVAGVANNINVLGLAANAGANAFPIYTYGPMNGLFTVENRTYLTPYVVDKSSTAGRKGTFTTIQAAVTQAASDVAAGTAALIFVRPGTYTEDIIIPAGVFSIVGAIDSRDNNILYTASKVDGVITVNNASTVLILQNIECISTLDISAGYVFVDSCTTSLSAVGATQVSIWDSKIPFTSTVQANTVFYAGNTYFETVNLTNGTNVGTTFDNCIINASVVGSTGGATFKNCQFNNGTTCISGSAGDLNLIDCTFQSLSGNSINCTGNVHYSNLSMQFGTGTSKFFSSSPTPLQLPMTTGNIYQGTRSAISYVVLQSDVYIGITNTGSARTVTLPSSGVDKNQVFIIKDESGGAAAHNITISVDGGVKTIDGAASVTISTNYGVSRIIYDGTNYFTW